MFFRRPRSSLLLPPHIIYQTDQLTNLLCVRIQ
jgi:hypothetical protein